MRERWGKANGKPSVVPRLSSSLFQFGVRPRTAQPSIAVYLTFTIVVPLLFNVFFILFCSVYVHAPYFQLHSAIYVFQRSKNWFLPFLDAGGKSGKQKSPMLTARDDAHLEVSRQASSQSKDSTLEWDFAVFKVFTTWNISTVHTAYREP